MHYSRYIYWLVAGRTLAVHHAVPVSVCPGSPGGFYSRHINLPLHHTPFFNQDEGKHHTPFFNQDEGKHHTPCFNQDEGKLHTPFFKQEEGKCRAPLFNHD